MTTTKTVIEDSEDDDNDLLDNSRGAQVAYRLQKELNQEVADTLSLLDILPASKVVPKKRKTPANNVSLKQGMAASSASVDAAFPPFLNKYNFKLSIPPSSLSPQNPFTHTRVASQYAGGDDSDDEPLIPARRTKACQVQPPPPSGLRRSARGQAPVNYAPAPVLSVDDDLPEDGVSEDQDADEDLPINATYLMQGRPGEAF
ncbi:hypothetical protein DER45DRAFT_633398 [Fusarium avenaceum]|nr:hypothetical protein DER45DRAFT_633398 [Fusarium avenaceum]